MYDPNKYKRDCYFFNERQEMGMTEPQCGLWSNIGFGKNCTNCACTNGPQVCFYYIPKRRIDRLAIKLVLQEAAEQLDREWRIEDGYYNSTIG